MASGISIWALMGLPGGVIAGKVVLYYLLALNGTFIFYLIYLLMLMPVFWTHSGRGFEYLHMAVSKFSERPDRIFTGWVRRAIVSVLPLALVASFPARLVLERFDWILFGHLVVVTLILFGVTVAVWKRGLRNYSSASS
jgi:ABC-2 type transport system permease protein